MDLILNAFGHGIETKCVRFLEVDSKLTNHVFILFQEFIYLIVYDVKMAIAVIIAGVSATHYASIMAACVSPQTLYSYYAIGDKHDILKDQRFCRREYYNRHVFFLLKSIVISLCRFLSDSHVLIIIIYATEQQNKQCGI